MKLSFSTLGCPEWTWGEIVAAASDLGYSGIEVRGVRRELFAPRVPQFVGDALPDTLVQLQKLNLVIPCLSSDSILHLQHYTQRSMEEITSYIHLARDLGTPYIRILGDDPNPWPGAPVDEVLVEETTRELGKVAQQNGVTLLLETNGWYSNTERLAKLLQKINCAGVAALWDVHHPYRYNHEEAKDTVDNLGDKIKHVHMKDSILTDRVRYTMMGLGDLPLENFVETLLSNSYTGFFSLEWLRRWELSLESAGISFPQYLNYMQGLLP